MGVFSGFHTHFFQMLKHCATRTHEVWDRLYLLGKRTQIAGSERVWANGLLDTYQALHKDEPNRRTLHFWKGSREGVVKVDHILVSRSAEILESAIVSEDQPMVSDHFPVTARVRFPLEK